MPTTNHGGRAHAAVDDAGRRPGVAGRHGHDERVEAPRAADVALHAAEHDPRLGRPAQRGIAAHRGAAAAQAPAVGGAEPARVALQRDQERRGAQDRALRRQRAADEPAAGEDQLTAGHPAVEVGRRAGTADAQHGAAAPCDDIEGLAVSGGLRAQRRPAGRAQHGGGLRGRRTDDRRDDRAHVLAGRRADGDDGGVADGVAGVVPAELRRGGRGAREQHHGGTEDRPGERVHGRGMLADGLPCSAGRPAPMRQEEQTAAASSPSARPRRPRPAARSRRAATSAAHRPTGDRPR